MYINISHNIIYLYWSEKKFYGDKQNVKTA